MLKGKKIIVGITGSIAAYKSALLVRLLAREGAEIRVIMTQSACNFISPLTLSTLSKNEVLVELSENNSWANHVMLGRWADIMVIAPLSCNTLFKMANGGCDNLLLAVYLSAICPVVVAPAMDEDMWKHPSTGENIAKLASFSNYIIPVENGELASGLTGDGRMSEPESIVAWLKDFFSYRKQLAGKKVMVTAGPTYEAIDPVRFIGNHSSGKMGIALAEECQKRGAEVNLIIGPTSESLPAGMDISHVNSAQEMYDTSIPLFTQSDIAIMCAAVADYSPVLTSTEKIKKTNDTLSLELKRTPDILKKLGELKKDSQIVVGFALETNNEREFALKKLNEKNADLMVLNSLNDAGAGFRHNTNKIIIFDKKGNEYNFDTKHKKVIAADIVNTILNYNA